MSRDPLLGAPKRVHVYRAELLAAATKHHVDPLLLAAIMDQETLCGTSKTLDRPGPMGRGDKEVRADGSVVWHGHGLMQIDDRAHRQWLISHDWTDPPTNIDYGAQVLADSIRYCRDVEAGIAGYNCGPSRAKAALKKVWPDATVDQKRRILSAPTTRQEYVMKVMSRVDAWRAEADKHKQEQNNDGVPPRVS
jgi:soluble lytic murein transglycosylase-like protein